MAIDHEQMESIFNAAVGMGAVERARYLDGACGDDADQRQQVEALLASHEQTDSFLVKPLHQAVPLAEGPGTRIGRYKLLQLIGEGGFGSVFMAEQEHPVRRKVALKIIKLGMDTKQVIARFEAERQALALMDHPNIARVFDAGATDTGRPYFVMELVRGVPITEYCDTNNLATRQRLELFGPVCHAVQHAHQKGIIHRDIKPSNILVTIADGSPIPKVIDFGIAKATCARLTEMTLFTEFRQLIGTPEYMSPEQAEMSGIDVDTRTDVYSLGVLLYQLLTGTTPFDPKELRSKAYGEIQRMIREVEPPRPSTRLSSLGATLAAVAAHRRIDPRKLGQLMRGELDWIVMKALDKDRTRRYDTPGALAADVRQYLENEPVAARPATATYRLRKFASKHKVGFAATAAVAAALVLGIVGTSAGLVHARSARQAAEQDAKRAFLAEQTANEQKVLAQQQADRATAVSGFLQSVLASARPGVMGGGQDAKVVDLLQWAESMIEKELAHEPDAQIETYYTLYLTYCSLNLQDGAKASLGCAYNVIRRAGREETELGIRVTIHAAKWVDTSFASLEERERTARTAAERAQRLLGESHEITLYAHGVLGQLRRHLGMATEAEASFLRLEEGVRRLGASRLSEPTTGGSLADYAWVLKDRGEIARAEAHFRTALKIASSAKYRIFPIEVWATEGLAQVLRSQGKWSEVEQVYDRALADMRPRVGVSQWPVLLIGHANVLRRLGRDERAAEVERELYIAQAALASAPASTPDALTRRAEMRIRMGLFKDALADSTRAIQLDPTPLMPWYYRGCLLAYLRDEPAYHAHCDAMLKRFEHSGPRDGERTAKTSLLLPGTVHLARLNEVLDRALAVDAGDLQAWDQLAKSMAEYRAGRFDACIDVAGKAAAGLAHDAAGSSTVRLLAAMAHHKLGKHQQAEAMLDEVDRYVREDVPKFGVDKFGSDYTVENWLILHVVFREAQPLIRGNRSSQ